MKKISVVVFIAVFSSILITSCSTNQSSQGASSGDQQNITASANNGPDSKLIADLVTAQYDEITLSRYALTKSMNQELKNIAQMMIADHTTFLDSLTALATKKNITIGNKDSTQTNNQINSWSDKKEDVFDKTWVSSMISAHKDAISAIQKALDNTSINQDTKNLLNATLPTVRKHLDMLNQCNDKLSKMKS